MQEEAAGHGAHYRKEGAGGPSDAAGAGEPRMQQQVEYKKMSGGGSREPAGGPLHLPPGFRFSPSDEELVVHYLCKRAASQPFAVPIIAELDLYKFDPWELPDKALFGEKEWYFFSPRERKYPNGSRPNRAAGCGYWKATGTDRPITNHAKDVGVKKALVFYKGRPPRGLKTNWIMHEYRLAHTAATPRIIRGGNRLDDWVLCRVYNKLPSVTRLAMQQRGPQLEEEEANTPPVHHEIEDAGPLKHRPSLQAQESNIAFGRFTSPLGQTCPVVITKHPHLTISAPCHDESTRVQYQENIPFITPPQYAPQANRPHHGGTSILPSPDNPLCHSSKNYHDLYTLGSYPHDNPRIHSTIHMPEAEDSKGFATRFGASSMKLPNLRHDSPSISSVDEEQGLPTDSSQGRPSLSNHMIGEPLPLLNFDIPLSPFGRLDHGFPF